MYMKKTVGPILALMVVFLPVIAFVAVGGAGSALAVAPPSGDFGEVSTFIGKIRYTTVVDGITREYIVHVPEKYKGDIAVPLVFMLHGTSGSGDEFYENIEPSLAGL